MSTDEMKLSPSMIVGAMERHVGELIAAFRQNDPMTLDVIKIKEHLGCLEPFLNNLKRMQDELRAAQQAAQTPAPPANGNGTEVRN